MKSFSNDLRLLIVSSVLVALLGVQTVADIVSEDRAAAPPTVAEASVGPRTPASLPKPEEKPQARAWREPLVEWNCSDKESPKPFAVQGRQLRLKGKGCGKELKAESFSIVNETNGFTASVFEKGKTNYETDLIPLREGRNRLRVQYWTSPSHKIETVFDVTSAEN